MRPQRTPRLFMLITMVLPVVPPEKRPGLRRGSRRADFRSSTRMHYALALPKMLRAYFQRHRPLLKHLCTKAHQSLTLYLRFALGKSKAHPAITLTYLIFGEYLDCHPHIHTLVADGLFTRDGQFHPLPELPIKHL